MNYITSTARAGRFLAASLFAVVLLFSVSAVAKAQGRPPYLVGQYEQSLQQVGSDAQAVESGQWYTTLPYEYLPGVHDRLGIVLYVDGAPVEGENFDINATGTPGDTVTVSWTYPLTSGTHHVEFEGIEESTYYTLWDDKETMVVD